VEEKLTKSEHYEKSLRKFLANYIISGDKDCSPYEYVKELIDEGTIKPIKPAITHSQLVSALKTIEIVIREQKEFFK
jgi:hypothetical protein